MAVAFFHTVLLVYRKGLFMLHCTSSYLTVVLLAASLARHSHAQFATVIDVPADIPSIESMTTIDSNTQVNLFDGGSIGDFVHAGNSDGTITNVEVNIFGGTVGRNFQAFSNSTVNIRGGVFDIQMRSGSTDGSSENVHINMSDGVLSSSEIYGGSTFKMSGGRVRDLEALDGSVVEISDGFFSGWLEANFGSVVTVTGGSVGQVGSSGLLIVRDGGNATVSGGSVRFSVSSNGSLMFSGGRVSRGSIVHSDSSLTLSGGVIDESFQALSDSHVELQGGEFKLDGVPVSGVVNLPGGSILTGTLADGSAFALSSVRSGGPNPSNPSGGGDYIADGTLTLTQHVLPPLASETIVVPSVSPPTGLRKNEILSLQAGGALGDNFTAVDSEILIDGGSVGGNMELVRGSLTLSSGTIGDTTNIHQWSVFRIDGGSVGIDMQARSGSTVSLSSGSIGSDMELLSSTLIMSGGTIGRDLSAESASKVRISGGSISRDFVATQSVVEVSGGTLRELLARDGSQVRISGGSVDRDVVARQSVVEVSGGTLTELFVGSGSTVTLSGGLLGTSGSSLRASADAVVHVIGREFVIDGVDITESLPFGQQVRITDWSESIAGTLTDGNSFRFVQALSLRDRFGLSPDTLVTVTLVPEPSCLVIAVGVWVTALASRRRELTRCVRPIHRSSQIHPAP